MDIRVDAEMMFYVKISAGLMRDEGDYCVSALQSQPSEATVLSADFVKNLQF
jgi:hypothetical protein